MGRGTVGMALAVLGWAGIAAAGIVGTKHDFSGEGWNPTGQICVVCHTPHNGRGALQSPVGLLWNRDVTPAVYTVYNSPTLDFVPNQPDGASRLCLSCHDGTIAIDRFGTQDGGTFFMSGARNLGTDLSNDHPISFTYDSALAQKSRTLKDPSTAPSGLGGTVQVDLLRGNKVQCVSCHNPHNVANISKFLIKSNQGSSLCLTCHNF